MTGDVSLLDAIAAPSIGVWRSGQADTARLAALAVHGISGDQRVALFGALARAQDGLTAHEAKAAVGEVVSYPHVASTRLTELARRGLVVQSNDKRLCRSGRWARVWRLTPAGIEAVRSAA